MMFYSGADLTFSTEVARSLQFSPHLMELADRVVHDMTDGGRIGFNGLHLRIEGDATNWIVNQGGIKVCFSSSGYVESDRPTMPTSYESQKRYCIV